MTLNERTNEIYSEIRAPRFYAGHRPSVVPANRALAAAKYAAETLTRFEHAEDAGLVKIESQHDDDPFSWELYFDCDVFDPECHPGHPGGARAILAEKKRAEKTIEDYGLMEVQTFYRTRPDGDWVLADSIGGIEGNADPRDANGCGPDLMRTALDALADALRSRCKECRQATGIN